MPQPGGKLVRAWDSLLNGLAYVAGLLVVAVTLAVIYEVVARYFFNRPTVWALDFTEYALVYITFLGAPWVLRDRAHTRMEIVVERLRPRLRLVLSIIVSLIAGATAAVMMWEGAKETLEAYWGGHAELKAWRVLRWRLIFPIWLGSLLLLIEFLRQAWNTFQTLRLDGDSIVDQPSPTGHESL